MSDRAAKSPQNLKPPPHANAEVHARIMADLRKMTPHEVFLTAVESGIYTPDGQLTAHYRDDSDGEE
jgi:hypothetical protein